MKTKKIKIPIYHGTMILIQTDNWEKLGRRLNLELSNDTDAFVYKDPKDRYVACFRSKPSPAIIAHEAVHVVNHVYNDGRMMLDPLNDEPQAYLTGWVVGEMHKFLGK